MSNPNHVENPDYIIDVEEWSAKWCCPKCKSDVDDVDHGVDDDGEKFNVICYACDYEYLVRKG